MSRVASGRAPLAFAFAFGCAFALVPPAHAVVPVVFGSSWDGPDAGIQSLADARYGVGKAKILTNYIGAAPGDPDPFFWVDGHFSALLIREIAGNANRNILGWYLQPADGQAPVIDGIE